MHQVIAVLAIHSVRIKDSPVPAFSTQDSCQVYRTLSTFLLSFKKDNVTMFTDSSGNRTVTVFSLDTSLLLGL